MSQQRALVAQKTNGGLVGPWLTNGWPVVDYRLTTRQRHALVAQEANGGLVGQWLANV